MQSNPPLSLPTPLSIVIHKILPIALPLLNWPSTNGAAPQGTHLQEDAKSRAQYSHLKWKPREVTIGMEYVHVGHSRYLDPICNSSLQTNFIMLENGSFNVFNLGSGDQLIMTCVAVLISLVQLLHVFEMQCLFLVGLFYFGSMCM